MKRLVIEAWLLLLYIECVMRCRSFMVLHNIVREAQVHTVNGPTLTSSAALCHAVDLACVFYFRQVMCLQRSAVTTLLLRRHGWRGEMVIGAQLLPFRSHAWVEINGEIVNDKPYMTDVYRVLERC